MKLIELPFAASLGKKGHKKEQDFLKILDLIVNVNKLLIMYFPSFLANHKHSDTDIFRFKDKMKYHSL